MEWLEDATDLEQFKSDSQKVGSFFKDEDLIKKVIKHGNNTFRIVGPGKVYWLHRFKAANGVNVMSICTKDKDGNGGDDCPVCQRWKEAWRIVENPKQYTPQQVEEADVIVGNKKAPGMNFSQSWGAKRHIGLNVLDRDQPEINAGANHTSLLCKTEYDRGITAAKKGIYEEIVKLNARNAAELQAHPHDWFPYDITLIKEGKGIDTSYDKEKGQSYPVSEAELKYERYNLDELLKPTDLNIVHKWLTKGTGGGDAVQNQQAQPPVQQQQQQYAPPPQSQGVQQPPAQPPVQPQTTVPPQTQPQGGFQIQPPVAPQTPPPTAAAQTAPCPKCKANIPITSQSCQYCGVKFAGYTEDDIPF